MGTWWVRRAAMLVLRGRPTSFKRSMKRHPRVVSVTGNSPSFCNCICWRLRADAKCLVIKLKRWQHMRPPVFSLTTGTIYVTLNRKMGHKWTREKVSVPGFRSVFSKRLGALQLCFVEGTWNLERKLGSLTPHSTMLLRDTSLEGVPQLLYL